MQRKHIHIHVQKTKYAVSMSMSCKIPFKSSLNEWYCTNRSLVHKLQYTAAMNLHNSKNMRQLKTKKCLLFMFAAQLLPLQMCNIMI